MSTSRRPQLESPQSPPATLSSGHVPTLFAALAAGLQASDVAIVEKNVREKSRRLEAATAVVFELIASVDFERGGELAPRLAALYGYFSSELLHIARTDDRQQLRSLLDMVGVLMDSWHDDSVIISS